MKYKIVFYHLLLWLLYAYLDYKSLGNKKAFIIEFSLSVFTFYFVQYLFKRYSLTTLNKIFVGTIIIIIEISIFTLLQHGYNHYLKMFTDRKLFLPVFLHIDTIVKVIAISYAYALYLRNINVQKENISDLERIYELKKNNLRVEIDNHFVINVIHTIYAKSVLISEKLSEEIFNLSIALRESLSKNSKG